MKTDTEWKRKYNSLKEFITSNPEIYLGTNEVSIPGHLRDEFYKQFDDVRRLFIQSLKSSYDFEDLQTLGKYYVEAENRLSETLGLKHMDLPVDLESFLHNPEKGMMRMLYNRLFELLQGKITEDDFKKTAEDDLKSRVVEMFRLGYEQWAAVSILLLLEPDEIHGVTLD
ncbi:MAG: hypothetical protein JXL81_09285, partial [Deltaproteobacteria bacterium]|nr:hypothetical protein [Deltaproteobacteria bacterium]